MKLKKTVSVSVALCVILLMTLLSACAGGEAPAQSTTAAGTSTTAAATIAAPTATAAATTALPTEPASNGELAQALLDAADWTTEEGIVAMVADANTVTIVEAEAIILSRLKYEYDQEKLEYAYDCPAWAAWSTVLGLSSEYELPAYEEFDELYARLLEHPEGAIRAYAIGQMSNMLGTSVEQQESVVALLKGEKEPIVIKAAMRTFGNDLASNAELGKLAFEYAKNSDPRIRSAVASALASTWNAELEGVVDVLIELLGDDDQTVRDMTARTVGSNGDERFVEPLAAILNNEEDVATHYSALNSLINMWYDYPAHKKTSEAAYNATMAYLKTTPRTKQIPEPNGFSGIKQQSASNFDAWKEAATYFKPVELCKVLADIAIDPDVTFLGRKSAVAVIETHGTKENLEAIKTEVAKLTDRDSERLIEELNTAIGKK